MVVGWVPDRNNCLGQYILGFDIDRWNKPYWQDIEHWMYRKNYIRVVVSE